MVSSLQIVPLGDSGDEFNLVMLPEIGGVLGSTLTRAELEAIVREGQAALDLPRDA